MMPDATSSSQDRAHAGPGPAHVHDSPFIRAPEGARTVFLVTVFAVCGPLLGGMVMFGWRAALTATLAVASCVATEIVYYRVTRVPAMLGRSHSVLTGVLLALTLPAFVPWFVPIVAGAFAIVVGKAVFGGVGHFVWQPALVGRLAVAVLFPALLTVSDARFEHRQPVLGQNRLLIGDVRDAAYGNNTGGWQGRAAPNGKDAALLTPPTRILRGLTDRDSPEYSAIVRRPSDQPNAKPAGLLQMPPMEDLFYGARPGGIGETSILLLMVACLYLVYRNYLKWELPLTMLLAAWVTAAVAPIYLAGPNDTVTTVWLPLLSNEGLAASLTYINYQVVSGGLALAITLVSVEMTSRPVTAGGQVLLGLGCGVLAMLLQLYTTIPIPCLMAVLAMNTLTPTIDRLWRPRVFGTKRLAFLRGK